MYGLFVSHDYTQPSFDPDPKHGPHIVLVDSESRGVHLLVEKLIECGLVTCPTERTWRYGDVVCNAEVDVLHAFQMNLGWADYYHVYPIVDSAPDQCPHCDGTGIKPCTNWDKCNCCGGEAVIAP